MHPHDVLLGLDALEYDLDKDYVAHYCLSLPT